MRLLSRSEEMFVRQGALKQIIAEYDADHSGSISLDEFCTLMIALANAARASRRRVAFCIRGD